LDKRHSYLIPVWARGSTFRVKNKEGIKDQKSASKMLIFQIINCHFGSKFWIRPDEADVFPRKYASQIRSREENGILNLLSLLTVRSGIDTGYWRLVSGHWLLDAGYLVLENEREKA